MGSHLTGVVFGAVGIFSFKQGIYGFKPQIDPKPKMLHLYPFVVLMVQFDMGFNGVAFEFGFKEKTAFPEVGKLFKVFVPVSDGIIKKMPNLLSFPHFWIKSGDQQFDIFPVFYVIHYSK